jgi:hypothetical protein
VGKPAPVVDDCSACGKRRSRNQKLSKSTMLEEVFEVCLHPHTAMDLKNVARHSCGIQLNVIAWALPQVSLTRQQIFGLEAAILRNFELVQRQGYKSSLRVVRIEIDDRYKQVRAIIRLLAIADQLIVVSEMES